MIVSLILYTPVFPSQLTPQNIRSSKHIPAELIALAPDLYSLKRSAWAHGKDVRTLTLTVKCTEFLFFDQIHCRLSKASHGSYKIVSRPAPQHYISSIHNPGKGRLLSGAACMFVRELMDANFVNYHPFWGGLFGDGSCL